MYRTILSALALMLAFAFAPQARAASADQLAGTSWATIGGSDGKITIMRLAFDRSDGFELSIEEGGKVVGQGQGTFTVMDDVLVLKARGKELRYTLVSVDNKTLVLRLGDSEISFGRAD